MDPPRKQRERQHRRAPVLSPKGERKAHLPSSTCVMASMRTLLIDNHDSFTFNLFHLLGEVNGEEPLVVRNDACSWEELTALSFDNIVISPGPGTPARASDLGLSADLLRYSSAPLLGVCLGHQALAQHAGGHVGLAPIPMHGRLDEVEHDGRGLFSGLPQRLTVVRYHSLIVHEPLPSALCVTARSRDGLVMALEARNRARWGVQFHPESICSQGGRQLLLNFRDLSRAALGKSLVGHRRAVRHEPKPRVVPAQRAYRLHLHELPGLPDAEAAFLACFSGSKHAFWLDSARVVPGLSRWSFMGSGRPGPRSLAALQAELRSSALAPAKTPVPFPFRGGWVGWIGYEAKRQCGYRQGHPSESPEVAFLRAERFLALDHQEGRAWAVCLTPMGEDSRESESWFRAISQQLNGLQLPPPPATGTQPPLVLQQRHDARAYLERIELARREIQHGESYELCLTNRLEVQANVNPLELYRHLRRLNPAPWAAYLKTGEMAVVSSSPERFLAASASGLLQAKPIKGTAPRHADRARDAAAAEVLRSNEKDRAENLMIVDLLRHDLGQVACLGSVRVPSLMAVESYATVHQLVSTVEASLAPGRDVIDAIQAAFPPGSMTGAPKARSLDILDRLEQGPRGIYSGALGWIGLDGAADLSVVIRTLVQQAAGRWSLGTGGAITALSDPQAELEEMYLKAHAPLSALALAATGSSDGWQMMNDCNHAAE